MIKIKLDQDLMLCNALIDTYAKCTALAEAERVFKCMPKRDIVSWTSLIEGYEEQGDCEVVIRLFLSMQESGISPDRVVLLSVLKACAGSGNIAQGRSIHNQLKSWGLAYDQLVCNALIDMYSKCRSLEEAHTVFSELESPNEVSWGAIISGYVNDGNGQAALQLVMSMLKKGQELGKPVLVSSIKACSFLLALPEGRLLHSHAIQHGLVSDTDIECSALNMYSRCGCIKDAMRVFDRLPSHDIVAWTSIILSCANHQKSTAVELFMKLQEEGIGFNTPILLCIVEACGGIKNIIQGRIMHHRILKYGMESDASIANLLISMYAKCQCLQEARSIFDMCTCRDEMTWGAIIAGYIHNAEDSLPCDLFKQCECTFFGREMVVCILKACSSTYSFVMGKITHFLAVHIGLETDLVIGSVLINMYTKCMSTHDALSVFNCLPAHDLVTYSTLIAGLVNFGQYFLALELHAKVPFEAHADKHVQQNMLTVCGILNLIRQGRHIHNEIIKNELDSDAGIRTALVDMYMNCSSLEEAQKVFISACEPDITMWGTVVAGYTHHGDCKKALQCVEHMNQHRISPTIRMFSTILSACSHAGAVEEGRHCFKLMTEECNILPRVEHLNCLIDLFGRAGHLDIASDLVTAMPTLPDTVGWKAFLISCQIYGQHELGHEFFDETVMEIYDTDVYSVSEDLCMEAFEGSKMQKSTMNNSEHAGSLLFNKKITSANNFTSFGHKLEYNKINIFSSLTLQ
ncbi:hypothetical protein KP509_36G011100 [Ceratopteris richardii]|nr:hypothetical protein KP509_36G011100 [Ceratopteris richardii]